MGHIVILEQGQCKDHMWTGRLHAAHGPHVSYACTKHTLNPLTSKGTQILQKSRSRFKIIDTGRVTWSKLRTEEPQIFFFLGPVSLCTECTTALGLLCSPNISFSTASIALCLVWRGKGPLLRLCLCLLVLPSASQRHYNAVEPTPRNSK